jgi:hypothetical protein
MRCKAGISSHQPNEQAIHHRSSKDQTHGQDSGRRGCTWPPRIIPDHGSGCVGVVSGSGQVMSGRNHGLRRPVARVGRVRVFSYNFRVDEVESGYFFEFG